MYDKYRIVSNANAENLLKKSKFIKTDFRNLIIYQYTYLIYNCVASFQQRIPDK